MIRTIERPDEMSHIPNDHNFFEVIYKEKPCAYMALSFVGNTVAVHLKVVKWSHQTKKVMLSDWEDIKKVLRSRGYQTIIAANEDYQDARWPKFIKHFGFQEPRLIAVSTQNIGGE